MLTVGIARIGNEPVVRFTNDGKPLLELSLAYNYGRKGSDGNTPTQWVKATLWGDRCEKLQPYLHKGAQIFAQLEELHIETYNKKDGSPGFDLRARIANIQLIGERRQEQREAAPHEQFQRRSPAPAPSAMDGLDDDIPF
jgi:single-strand DNA-binding protein